MQQRECNESATAVQRECNSATVQWKCNESATVQQCNGWCLLFVCVLCFVVFVCLVGLFVCLFGSPREAQLGWEVQFGLVCEVQFCEVQFCLLCEVQFLFCCLFVWLVNREAVQQCNGSAMKVQCNSAMGVQ